MSETLVTKHYSDGDLGERILAALRAAGKDLDALSVDDLAPVDAFHIRGRSATEALAREVALDATDTVLDVGSGLGGTARYLASRTGCHVTGIDLTEEYCRVAAMLSERVGLADLTEFRSGSACQLPFPDAHFDVAWTEHVQMNVADKERFYGEIARVLKPGGRFAFHDILAGSESGLHLPVPWAGEATISHLIDVEALRALLKRLGLCVEHWQENTDESIEFFRGVQERTRIEGPSVLGLHVIVGADASTRLGNVLRNLEDGHIRVLQGVLSVC